MGVIHFNSNKQATFTCNNTYTNPHLLSVFRLVCDELIPQYCIDNNLIQSEHNFKLETYQYENDLWICVPYESIINDLDEEEKINLGIEILFDMNDINYFK